MSMPRSRPRARRRTSWAKIGGPARARHLYALARAVQRHGRLFAVLESLDGGKPVRESRDIDIPLVARHFYHHAGWAQLQEREFADHVPVGVVGQVIPWNFPLLMLAWKLAPALALGNTVVLKPAEFTSLTALLFAEIAAQAGLAGRRAQHRDRRGPDRRRPGRPSRRQQDRLHRLDRSRPPDPRQDGGLGQDADPGARRQVALHHLRRCRSRRRGRRRGGRHLAQPGPGLLRRLAPAAAGRHRGGFPRAPQAPHDQAAGRPSARQGDRHGRDRRAGAAEAHPVAGADRRLRKAARSSSPISRCPRTAASSRRPCSATCSRPRP